MIWVTSDYHLGHRNIIKYCGRPYSSVEEMDEKIIEKHNSLIAPDDVVYFLGDFCFYKDPVQYIERLNGRFVWVIGNHDKVSYFKHLPEEMSIEFGGERIALVHNPVYANYNRKINLVGHVHEHWKFKRSVEVDVMPTGRRTFLANVGIDVWDFAPVKLRDVVEDIRRVYDYVMADTRSIGESK